MPSCEDLFWSIVFGGIGGIVTVLALKFSEARKKGKLPQKKNGGEDSMTSVFQVSLKEAQEHDES